MEILCAGVVAGARLLHLLRHALHRQADCVALEGGRGRESVKPAAASELGSPLLSRIPDKKGRILKEFIHVC